MLDLVFEFVRENKRNILLNNIVVATLDWIDEDGEIGIIKCTSLSGRTENERVHIPSWFILDDDKRMTVIYNLVYITIFPAPPCPMTP